MMGKNYLVLGAGWQGSAAAYDLARFGSASRIVLADAKEQVAADAARRLNSLLNKEVVVHRQVDVKNEKAVERILENADVCLSAVPYYYNVSLAQAAVSAGCHFCDLGGNTAVVFQQHELSDRAQQAGITIAPDCGLAPGMANILAAYGIQQLQGPKSVQIFVGGLPQNPRPPLDYSLSFNIEGLTNEYFGKAHILRNGKVVEVDTFSELEAIDFREPVGKCEAFITSGGTSTCPWTFEGVLETYEEKTVRYPGHYEKMKVISDLGLLDEQPIQIGEIKVVPRQVFHAVAGPRLSTEDPKDIVVLRVVVEGEGGKIRMELLDFYDEAMGFSAMQRTTGFGAAIVAIMLARGELARGTVRIEEAVDSERYISEMKRRSFLLKIDRG